MSNTRRQFIALVGAAPIAALAGPRGTRAQDTTCYTPSALPMAQKSMRRSVRFVDRAPDPAKRCGTCAFFKAGQNGCGECQILSGGPVAAQSYCTSYALKTK